MDLKKLIEQNMTLFSLGLLLAGFLAGIGVVAYLEGREDRLRESLKNELGVTGVVTELSARVDL